MKLDPANYKCPGDGNDLTDLVEEALGDSRPLAYVPPPLRRASTAARRFEVIVTCPGAAGSGEPHQLTCAGTFTP
jgi:hypothetical protein